MSWGEASNWASTLTFQNNIDWELPTVNELQHLYFDELGGVSGSGIHSTHSNQYNLFSNIMDTYWTATGNSSNFLYAQYISFNGGGEGAFQKTSQLYASAVHAGNVMPAVPEPETYVMLLVGFGLMGFIVRYRKTKLPAYDTPVRMLVIG